MISAPDSRPFIVFQETGDARLRGISWDGSISGLFSQSGPFGLISQSPDGRYVVLDGSLYDRHGHVLGAFPWAGKDFSATWTPDSSAMCKAVPVTPITGSPMRLQVAGAGQAPRTVAQGYVTYSDNASFPVLACDPKRDRAIVAEFGQGIAPSAIWIIQLSTNTVVRTINAPGATVAATSDAMFIARSAFPSASGQTLRTSVERADDGGIVGTVPDFDTHGFSGDGALLVGLSGLAHAPAVVNWRTGQRVWTGSGRWFGYLVEPGGPHIVVGLSTASGELGDAYLIGAGGVVKQLPTGMAAALQP